MTLRQNFEENRQQGEGQKRDREQGGQTPKDASTGKRPETGMSTPMIWHEKDLFGYRNEPVNFQDGLPRWREDETDEGRRS